MKIKHYLLVSLLTYLSISSLAQTTIYTNDMDYVIGDAKQAFIQDKISTTEQIEFLLIGFKAMKVNGIRVPIFPEGYIPNEAAVDYFIKRANEEGFKIFANTAQSSGGQHVANQSFDKGETIKGNDAKTQVLIDRILDFDKKHDCAWINPFNEDGRTNLPWTIDQMNTLYSSLKAGLVNAELIGSCAWGLVASTDVLKKTDIEKYITVSTSHNLGFNHSLWTEFITLSHAAGLPVWDSEVNHNRKFDDKATRLEAALQYGVDGLVLYDSWKGIDLTTGAISNGTQNQMDLYLKPTSLDEGKRTELFADIYNESNGFRIEFLNSEKHNVSVVDITGKQIYSYHNISDNELQVRGLENGIYIVVMDSQNIRQVEKIIIQ